MSADDPTLPGRPTRLTRERISTQSLRVVEELRPVLERAFEVDGPARAQLLEQAIGKAIDQGRASGTAAAEEVERLRGELSDRQQVVELLREKLARTEAQLRVKTKALDETNARLARMMKGSR